MSLHNHSVPDPQATAGWTHAYIGLGSNLGDPVAQLRAACAALERSPGIRWIGRSSLYRSRPLGDPDQPDYLNAVAVLETRLDAAGLLTRLQAIEAAQGRVRGPRQWMPRTLDLDLLVFGEQRHDSARLTVPHPELTRREFVLYPLYEIAADLVIPGVGRLRDCIEHCPLRGLQRVEDEA